MAVSRPMSFNDFVKNIYFEELPPFPSINGDNLSNTNNIYEKVARSIGQFDETRNMVLHCTIQFNTNWSTTSQKSINIHSLGVDAISGITSTNCHTKFKVRRTTLKMRHTIDATPELTILPIIGYHTKMELIVEGSQAEYSITFKGYYFDRESRRQLHNLWIVTDESAYIGGVCYLTSCYNEKKDSDNEKKHSDLLN